MVDFYGGASPMTLLCPIKNGQENNQSFASLTREYLQSLDELKVSPLSKVPETFLCRFYILNDVFFEGLPAKEDHLKSKYLVFCCNYRGTLNSYISGFWQNAQETAKNIWKHCVAFESVKDSASFVDYIKRCEVNTTFFFNGSSGRPLQEQLKALYLKQEFTQFAVTNQNLPPVQLRQAFRQFLERSKPGDLNYPSWSPGMKNFDFPTEESFSEAAE